MKRFLTLPRLAAIFFSVFAVALAGIFIFQRLWVEPGEQCLKNGGWYDLETRICARPIYIPDITGRAEGETRAQASDRGNKELMELETQAAAYDRARDAATEAERARVKAINGR